MLREEGKEELFWFGLLGFVCLVVVVGLVCLVVFLLMNGKGAAGDFTGLQRQGTMELVS